MRLRGLALAAVGSMGTLAGLLVAGPWVAFEEFAARHTSVEPDRSVEADRVGRSALASAFWGVSATGDPDGECRQLLRIVATLHRDAPPPIARRIDLLRYLEDGHPPSWQDGLLWRATLPVVGRTQKWLITRTGPASLATLVEVSIREAGSTSMGVLAAHNLLKELTLSGRRLPLHAFPQSTARLAESLTPWRRAPRLPAGGYDRLGPLYHVLAAFTLVTWTASPTLGVLAADYEALRRIARVGRDRPDPEKARADRCGVEAGALLLRARRE